MSQEYFKIWYQAMGYRNLHEAAKALGMGRRQIAGYHSGERNLPVTVKLAMAYILETGKDASYLASIQHSPAIQSGPEDDRAAICPPLGPGLPQDSPEASSPLPAAPIG